MKSLTLAQAMSTGRGTERSFRCHMHDDTNASASVNVLNGFWCCYACGASGKADESLTIPDEKALLAMITGEQPARMYSEAWLDTFDASYTSAYWSKRFGADTSDYFRCGTHPFTGCPTYPIRDANGDVLGVVQRQNTQPKYLYPFGVSISRTLFGDIKPASVVVLVEGAADVMALHQAGIPPSWSVLGCYGAGIHAPQVRLIADMSPKYIVLAFDNDEAGANAASRTQEQLQQYAPIIHHQWSDHKDPGEMPVETRITSIESTLAKKKVST